MKNRFMLAPLTNQQSNPDGTATDDDYRWLTMRAEGGFGLTMTCALHVQACGQGFPGQLGIFGDQHLPGLSRLAEGVRARNSVSSAQLHHAGHRAPRDLVELPVAPSDDPETGARGLSLGEVEQLREDFITAAVRAQYAGFDGVEVHGAHNYILTQFLSPASNRREDRYGGTPENRARLVLEIIDGIRSRCRPDFQVGLRLSAERYGLRLNEIRDLAARVMREGHIDYLDMSLWDVSKDPVDDEFKGRPLIGYFTELPRGNVRLGAAGKIRTAEEAISTMNAGCDFVLIGRAAILRHDVPVRIQGNPRYESPQLPVAVQLLEAEGVGRSFVHYLRTSWPDFVQEPSN